MKLFIITLMDLFKIGDTIIYPNQGLAVIEDIQEESYYGETFKIFHVRILSNDTLVLVPSSNTSEMGIRKPVSSDSIEKIFEFMKNGDVDVTMNWKGRYKENLVLMKSGEIKDIAFVLKSLYSLNLTKPLSFREKKMMDKAKELLVTELSEVTSVPSSAVEKKLLESLSKCFKDVAPHIDS